ncbi:MAG: Holliday junction branch migration protein RuvA, partial [Candidatus Omnitrophica bacterium]|nr:Holliday junction branch migration protein RuvA [Candidatus Omnitrophota bacterium]
MISRIKGKIKDIKELSIFVEIGNLTYEILIPPAVMNSIGNNIDEDIELITYHYYQTDQSKSVPVLIGFLNEVEKEFFERFISVSGVGPK